MKSLLDMGGLLPYEILDEGGNLIATFYSKNDMLHCMAVLQERHSKKKFHTADTYYYDYDYESDTPEAN